MFALIVSETSWKPHMEKSHIPPPPPTPTPSQWLDLIIWLPLSKRLENVA